MVPILTPHELSTKVMIERVEMIRESLAPKKRLGLLPFSFLTLCIGADILVDILIALCRGNYKAAKFYYETRGRNNDLLGPPTDGGILYKGKWHRNNISANFQRICGPESLFCKLRQLRPAKRGLETKGLKPQRLTLIEEVNEKVCAFAMMADAISPKQAVLDLASTEDASKDLNDLCAQAFDAAYFIVPDRCWSCRITFGFKWQWFENNPTNAISKDRRDFEGLWGENSVQTQPCEHRGVGVGVGA